MAIVSARKTQMPPDVELQTKPRKVSLLNHIYALAFMICLILTILFTSRLLISFTDQNRQKPNWTRPRRYHVAADCGRSREEAVQKGCVFDVIGIEWVPKQCYDSKLAAESVAEGTALAATGVSGVFPWFKDENHTIPIAQSDLNTLDSLVGHTWERFHVAHCLYSWRKVAKTTRQVLLGEKDVFMSESLLSEDHINHCNMVIGDHSHRSHGKAEVTFSLGKCYRLEL
jgi:hypothetical protein